MYHPTYHLSHFQDFASAATKAEIEAHDGQLAQLEIEETAIDAEASDLAADPAEILARRFALAKQQHVVLQERFRIVAGLESDRQHAESDASLAIEPARREVQEGLRRLGYGPMLAGDPVTRQQMVVFIDQAEPVQRAIRQWESLRRGRPILESERLATSAALGQLTANCGPTCKPAYTLKHGERASILRPSKSPLPAHVGRSDCLSPIGRAAGGSGVVGIGGPRSVF